MSPLQPETTACGLTGADADVDVLMPYHHNLQFVSDAVDSILWQSGVKTILHLVNDCAVEDDAFLQERYGQCPNVRWYRTSENKGPYATANALFDYCESDFIAIRDSDDISYPGSLLLLINQLKKENGDLIGGKMVQFITPGDENKDKLQRAIDEYPVMDSYSDPLRYPYPRIINGTMVIRRRVFEELNGYCSDYLCGADLEFVARAHESRKTLLFASDVVGLRRVLKTSISRSHPRLGYGSVYRDRVNEEWSRRYRLWEADRKEGKPFDPGPWGRLDDDRGGGWLSPVRPAASVRKPRRSRKVYLCIAASPRRIYALQTTLASLINQVDSIKIYLNGFKFVPDFLKNDKIEIIFGDNSRMAVSRFYWADKLDGYIFTCDDDLIYPPDYVARGIEAVEKYRCLCGAHGSAVRQREIASYYKDRVVYGGHKEVKEDVRVDVLGTGAMCFHTDDVKLSMAELNMPGREDFALYKLAVLKSYDRIVYAHPDGWLRPSIHSNDRGLWSEAILDDREETRIINKYQSKKSVFHHA